MFSPRNYSLNSRSGFNRISTFKSFLDSKNPSNLDGRLLTKLDGSISRLTEAPRNAWIFEIGAILAFSFGITARGCIQVFGKTVQKDFMLNVTNAVAVGSGPVVMPCANESGIVIVEPFIIINNLDICTLLEQDQVTVGVLAASISISTNNCLLIFIEIRTILFFSPHIINVVINIGVGKWVYVALPSFSVDVMVFFSNWIVKTSEG